VIPVQKSSGLQEPTTAMGCSNYQHTVFEEVCESVLFVFVSARALLRACVCVVLCGVHFDFFVFVFFVWPYFFVV
jgi:hypothetical protein